MRKPHAQGFTLTEVLAVLVVGVLVMAVVAAGISKAFGSNEIVAESRNIHDLLAASRGTREPTGFPSDLLAVLEASGNLSGLSSDGAGNYFHTWNGPVTVAGNTGSFVITYGAVPYAACIKLAAKIAQAGAIAVQVNGAPIVLGQAQSLTDQVSAECTDTGGNQLQFAPPDPGIPAP